MATNLEILHCVLYADYVLPFLSMHKEDTESVTFWAQIP